MSSRENMAASSDGVLSRHLISARPCDPAPRISRPAPRATVPGSWSLAEVERSWKSAGSSPPARRGRWQHTPRAPLTNYPIATNRANELETMVLARGKSCPMMRKGPMVFQTQMEMCGGRPAERWLCSRPSGPAR